MLNSAQVLTLSDVSARKFGKIDLFSKRCLYVRISKEIVKGVNIYRQKIIITHDMEVLIMSKNGNNLLLKWGKVL